METSTPTLEELRKKILEERTRINHSYAGLYAGREKDAYERLQHPTKPVNILTSFDLDTSRHHLEYEIGRAETINLWRAASQCMGEKEREITGALIERTVTSQSKLCSLSNMELASLNLAKAAGEVGTGPYSTYAEKTTASMEKHVRTFTAVAEWMLASLGQKEGSRGMVTAKQAESMSEDELKGITIMRADTEELLTDLLEGSKITMDDLAAASTSAVKVPETFSFRLPHRDGIDCRNFASHVQSGKMSMKEKLYGIQAFDCAVKGLMVGDVQKNGMKELGVDQFDLIFINGKSVNEIYGKQYEGLSPCDRQYMMQCQVTAAVMDNKSRVDVCRVEQKNGEYTIGGPASVTADLQLKEPKLSIGDRLKCFFTGKPKPMPMAKLLENHSKSDIKGSVRREEIAGAMKQMTERHYGRSQEQREKITLKELDGRKEHTAAKVRPVERSREASKSAGKTI